MQWEADVTEEQRAEVLAGLGGTCTELIQTATMKAVGEGVLEVIQLARGSNVERVLEAYRGMAGVRFAEVDQFVQPQASSNDPIFTLGYQWGMYSSDVPEAVGPDGTTNPYGSQAELAWHQGLTGSSSVVVGIIDQGFDYTHEDLAANSWVNPFDALDGVDNDGNGYVDDIRGWDFFYNDNSTYDGAFDDHGTHVAGTIGAVGGNGTGVAGVNWDVSMISAKFLGPNGGYISGVVMAMDYLTDLKWRHGLNIVATNNSWSGGGFSQALQDAMVRAAKENILIVTAAGNMGEDNDDVATYPSCYSTVAGAGYEAVLSVTAIDEDGNILSNANYGATSVDLAAPGSNVLSTLPGDDYGSESGTSMAAPFVTGAIALYAASNPTALADQIRTALLTSTTPTPSVAGITVTGGRLNVSDFLDTLAPSAFSITASQVLLSEGQSGTTQYQFQINRHGSSEGALSVAWQVTGSGTAPADGADFLGQALPGATLNFAPGETSKTITVNVQADGIQEATEAFSVVLTNPSDGATLAIGAASASSLILNDDGVVARYNPTPITIRSVGSGLPFPSTLMVETGSALPVSALEVTLYDFSHNWPDDVDILLVGPTGAKALLMSDVGGGNFVDGLTLTFSSDATLSLPDSATLTSGNYRPTNFQSGDIFNSAAPAGPYTADLGVFTGTNPNGTWQLFLQDDTSTGTGRIAGGWSLAITTQPPSNTVFLAVSPDSVLEDSSGMLVYTFSRTGSLANALTVKFAVSGNANLDTDYSGIAASGSEKTITFASGASTATLILAPIVDAQVESDETIALTLLQGTGYTVGTTGAIVSTIRDDDFQAVEAYGATKLLRDGGDKLYAQQGNGTPIAIKSLGSQVPLLDSSGWQVLAAETVAGVNQVMRKNITNNSYQLWTLDAAWNVQSSTGDWQSGSSQLMAQENNFLQDFNNDGIIGPGSVTLSVSPQAVSEDGPANLIFTFSRTGTLANDLIVNYSVAGSASLGSDYTGVAPTPSIKTVSFAAGSSTTTVTVDPTSDLDMESDETVGLTLLDGAGYRVGTAQAVVGTILNDDSQVIESIGATSLIRDRNSRLYAQVGTNSPVGMRIRGRQLSQGGFPGWEPLAAETIGGANQMIWKNTSANYLSLWTMDSNWGWLSTTGEWGLTSAGALLQENNFQQDFNANNIIGA
ncbi:MAG: S8 family serine peptidase [Cyanobacteriota bacterium]|nr:S8 family serine peptidase [Cyanobacteriota bacterium]